MIGPCITCDAKNMLWWYKKTVQQEDVILCAVRNTVRDDELDAFLLTHKVVDMHAMRTGNYSVWFWWYIDIDDLGSWIFFFYKKKKKKESAVNHVENESFSTWWCFCWFLFLLTMDHGMNDHHSMMTTQVLYITCK